MRSTYLIAAIIAALLLIWLFSGELTEPNHDPAPSLATSRAQDMAKQDDTPRTRVRARLVQSSVRHANVVVRGRTAPERQVNLRAEVAGKVTALPKDKGDRVAAGDVICELDKEDRAQRVTESEQALNQARIEYQGAVTLKQRGLQSDTQIAQAQARLGSAEANLERSRLTLANTRIRAPFPGIISARPVELGDFIQPGSSCATILDADPMLVVGEVSEQDVVRLDQGMPVVARLMAGGQLQGKITYIAPAANPATRTYEVEASVPNPDLTLRAGLSADVRIAAQEIRAHLISAALLGLDDAGGIGVRTLDGDDRVVWIPVKIVNDDPDGRIWVSGLPDLTRLITVGQEMVVPGELVDVDFEQSPSTPAARPSPTLRDANGSEPVTPQATASADAGNSAA